MSLGSRGAVGATGTRVVEGVPPMIDAICAIGAGDALAAAFVVEELLGESVRQRHVGKRAAEPLAVRVCVGHIGLEQPTAADGGVGDQTLD